MYKDDSSLRGFDSVTKRYKSEAIFLIGGHVQVRCGHVEKIVLDQVHKRGNTYLKNNKNSK
jgi:hypothetical protein